MVVIHGTERIFGQIELSGAKNAALPVLVAACFCSETVTLKNMPVELNDIKVMISVLQEIGYQIEVEDHNVIVHNPAAASLKTTVPDQAGRIR